MLYTYGDDFSLTPNLLINGVFDVPLTNFLIKNLHQGNTFIDAGANIGYFSVLAGYLVGTSGRVLSYEVNPKVHKLLLDNISVNNLHTHVKCLNKGVYSSYGEIPFYMSKRFNGNGSLIEQNEEYFNIFKNDEIEKVMVETEPLSMRIEDIGFVNILKIDIEGAEYQAFLGLENNLKNKMIGSIVFELNKLRIGEEWYDFYEFLNKLRMIYGWEFYTLSVDGDLVLSDLKELFTLDFVENVVMVLK